MVHWKSKTNGLLVLLVLSLSVLFACSNGTNDKSQLYGVWRATTYEINGVVHEQDGIIIVTPDYLVSNTIFNADGDDAPDANANSGPIEIEKSVIVMEQWMQLHWRTANEEENFLAQDIVERIPYRIDGDLLIFEFPSGNRYISKRLSYLAATDLDE